MRLQKRLVYEFLWDLLTSSTEPILARMEEIRAALTQKNPEPTEKQRPLEKGTEPDPPSNRRDL